MVKKLSLMSGAAGLLTLLLASPAWSQQQASVAVPKASRLYNPQKVETLTGTVVAVNRLPARKPGRPERVMMELKTDQGIIKVHLGPADYVDRQTLKLASGDQVQVRGVKVTHRKSTVFIAGAVKKGDQVMQLRNDVTGRPLWTKGRKRNQS